VRGRIELVLPSMRPARQARGPCPSNRVRQAEAGPAAEKILPGRSMEASFSGCSWSPFRDSTSSGLQVEPLLSPAHPTTAARELVKRRRSCAGSRAIHPLRKYPWRSGSSGDACAGLASSFAALAPPGEKVSSIITTRPSSPTATRRVAARPPGWRRPKAACDHDALVGGTTDRDAGGSAPSSVRATAGGDCE
jgi:hypothetical protein